MRRHARELELDINQVPGSGKGGRVTHADLEAYTSPAPTPAWSLPAPVAPVALPQSQGPAPGEEQAIKIIGLRRKIAEQMVKARFTAPHFTYVDEVDMTDLVEARKRLKGIAAARGVKLTFLPFIMKALVQVFRRFPNANANVIEDPFTLVLKGNVNIGIATDTDRGLYVPVVKDVQAKTVLQLAAEIQDLTERTRQGKVSVDELQGGSFTITSVGNIGGMFATPIINHPEVAILGINRIHKRPVVMDDDSIAVRHMLYLSSSFDHRVLDGAVAARFTTALKELLETPEALLLEMI
ncbi:MAG: 2-oxo acid dehydrogenase subunit E2 [Alphaproteobacteria bacterium]|nr:2-oxo acid dehydrogenase subunit E2 [Alphaproteobacteria bacterium]